MLINYNFENFRSFKGDVELSMKAGRERTFNENLIRVGKKGRYLPSAVIYGANASGKSNIIMSLSTMRSIILSGTIDSTVPTFKPLSLCPFFGNDQNPMKFDVEFIEDGIHFKYGFAVLISITNISNGIIVEEHLSIINPKSITKIFERSANHIEINPSKRLLDYAETDQNTLKNIEDKINKNLTQNELFLSRGFKTIVSNELAGKVINFFKNKLFALNDFSLGQIEIKLPESEKLNKNSAMWNGILDKFVKIADFGSQQLLYKAKEKGDEITGELELISIYNDKIIVPSELVESKGTLKLVEFAVLFVNIFESGGTFVIDEFDSAIHSEIIKGLIGLFNDPSYNINGAQLIFTTHNPIYLNNKLFRRDQILFIEKSKDDFSSSIFSLADFGSEDVRNDENYLINYFKGKYSALPYIDFAQLLTEDTAVK